MRGEDHQKQAKLVQRLGDSLSRFSPLSSHSRPLRSSLPHSIPAGGRSEGTERYATR